MFGLGMPELIVILIIVLVIFGANRLPQLGEGLGKAIRGFKKGISDSHEEPAKKENKENKG
ncbi:MAG TPA: twin-arginine translocase TatA/TatE family subunit [Nitrospirota bacterium]|nr:twin-arginine translocase TatA/TatE family subunit [Nitrospirota bacterium]